MPPRAAADIEDADTVDGEVATECAQAGFAAKACTWAVQSF